MLDRAKAQKENWTVAHVHPVHCRVIARPTENSIEFFDCVQKNVIGAIEVDPEITGGNFCFDRTGKWVYATGDKVSSLAYRN